ncbi:pre-mRNA-splicing factor Sad1p [[Candida] railenensis]|uniref:Pre-mRNA-splicing factor Sad1p n=1 Tax=[Candida] railenensis TaxID=45579 RepID=A0A9P0W0G0_9ASCO|nr:pre-mRNA-splicing factor Sad1p [[Candida] railenensis]
MTTTGVGSDVSDEEYVIPTNRKRQKLETSGDVVINSDLPASSHYLETVNVNDLNFDYDKICSVTLSDVNVYCCLCCGKYFQGRSKQSPAYLHSVNNDHHVFINMESLKVFILPENKEICIVENGSSSNSGIKVIDNIRYAIDPKYTLKDLKHPQTVSVTADGKRYSTGFIGLNSYTKNNLINVVFQILSHIPAVRDYYLLEKEKENGNSELSKRFGLIVRKIWSPRLFRNHVAAHEFVVAVEKEKTYSSIFDKMVKTTAISPGKFLDLVLIVLDRQMSKKSKSIFSKTFQGKVQVTSIPLVSQRDEQSNTVQEVPDSSLKRETISRFWNLTLDIPPIATTSSERAEIPQVKLESLLAKYNGITTKTITTASSGNHLVSYKLIKLPHYLIFDICRNAEVATISSKNKYNATVVTFPITLDMSPYFNTPEETLIYDLVSTVKRTSTDSSETDDSLEKHEWTVRLQKDETEWVAISDLIVEQAERELMFLDENYLMVWKRRRV